MRLVCYQTERESFAGEINLELFFSSEAFFEEDEVDSVRSKALSLSLLRAPGAVTVHNRSRKFPAPVLRRFSFLRKLARDRSFAA